MTLAKLYRYSCWPVTAGCCGGVLLLLLLFQPHFMTSVNERTNLLAAYDMSQRWMFNVSFAIILVFTVVSYWIPTLRHTLKHSTRTSPSAVSHASSDPNQPSFKIITINKIDWNVLYSTLKSYRTETNVALEYLSMTLEAVESEENKHDGTGSGWKLSHHIRDKILRLSNLYDEDIEMLENELLIPFQVVHALPDSILATSPLSVIEVKNDGDINMTSILKTETNFTWWSEKNAQKFANNKVETYDSIRQVIAHLVRDWSSSEGAPIRESIYSWCIEQLQLHQYVPTKGPILVPGAGLGRLAWDISRNLRCAVEAIESSICMTAVAYSVFNAKQKNAFVLHPFAADSFSNEIDDEARYDAIYFPDVIPSIDAGNISYTVGTFGYDSMQHCSNQYGAVVTSFFIDTATTVYDFITTVAMILSSGGLWINVGPLQWHINNKVPVAVNELRMILENFRDQTNGKHVFNILHWSVDENPIRYRNHGGRKRSTYYDGYCPLRFVIRRNAT